MQKKKRSLKDTRFEVYSEFNHNCLVALSYLRLNQLFIGACKSSLDPRRELHMQKLVVALNPTGTQALYVADVQVSTVLLGDVTLRYIWSKFIGTHKPHSIGIVALLRTIHVHSETIYCLPHHQANPKQHWWNRHQGNIRMSMKSCQPIEDKRFPHC